MPIQFGSPSAQSAARTLIVPQKEERDAAALGKGLAWEWPTLLADRNLQIMASSVSFHPRRCLVVTAGPAMPSSFYTDHFPDVGICSPRLDLLSISQNVVFYGSIPADWTDRTLQCRLPSTSTSTQEGGAIGNGRTGVQHITSQQRQSLRSRLCWRRDWSYHMLLLNAVLESPERFERPP